MTTGIKNTRTLENYTNDELFTLYRSTGRLDIKQELAMRYIYIVRSIAIQMKNVYMGFEDIDDIINEGVITIMKSIDRYDVTKNAKFETYISKRIRGMILDIARKKDLIPRATRKSYKDICQTSSDFYKNNGREPTSLEVSEILDLDVNKYHDIINTANLFSVLSLDMLVEELTENKTAVQIPSENLNERPEQNYLDKELLKVLASGIRELKEKEQMVLSLYYAEEINMKEIANILDVSEPRVSQIHSGAIKKLREYLKEHFEI